LAIFNYDEFILPPYAIIFIRDDRVFRAQGARIPRLRSLQYSGSPEEIEGHLPEECINCILEHFGKPRPIRFIVQMA